MVIVAQVDLEVGLVATRASRVVKVKERVVLVDSIRAQEQQAVVHPDQRGGINEP